MARTPQAMPADRRIVVPGDLMIQKHWQRPGCGRSTSAPGSPWTRPNCSMCLGVASRKAGKGEVWLSSQNRNFENRMGEGSLAWLASAATVGRQRAGDAGQPTRARCWTRVDRDRLDRILQRKRTRACPRSSPPSRQIARRAAARRGTRQTAAAAGGDIRARVQRFGDSVDTDAIIPGEFCHLTDLKSSARRRSTSCGRSSAQRAQEARRSSWPARAGASGSSREQAVWALQGAGIQAVIAKSYRLHPQAQPGQRGAAVPRRQRPAFYELASEGAELEVDLATRRRARVRSGREFQAQTPTPMIQALTAEGGLVPAIQATGRMSSPPSPPSVI